MNGRSDTIFDPDGNITRGEFAKILAYASQDDLSQYKGTSNFADSKATGQKLILTGLIKMVL